MEMSIKYYILAPAVDTNETGNVYPQVSKMRPGYNYNSPNSIHLISRDRRIPTAMPDLDYFIASGKAKMTDLLSMGILAGEFLISPKLKEILSSFNLPEHKFFLTRVEHKKKFYDYYWMYFLSDLTDFVDYGKSSFFLYLNYTHNIGKVEILSKVDFDVKKKKVKMDNPEKTITIWSEHIALSNQQAIDLDFFEIGIFDGNIYISERLYKAIIENKITGVKLEHANNISFA